MHSFLETLKGLSNLVELRLMHEYTEDDSDPGCPHMHELCAVIPHLRRLKSLTVKQWVTHNSTSPEYNAWRRVRQRDRAWPMKRPFPALEALAPPMLDVAPSPFLTSVTIDSSDNSFKYIDWLLRPRGDYLPKRVSLSLHSIEDVPDNFDKFWDTTASWFRHADYVHFDMLSWTRYRYVEDPQLRDSSKRMISSCQAARSLTLSVYGEQCLLDVSNATIPRQVEILHINVLLYQAHPSSREWQTQMEKSVHALLKNSDASHLKEVIITPDSYQLRERWRTYTLFTASGMMADLPMMNISTTDVSLLERYCQKRKIKLVFANNPFSSIV
jgi:hypothetical protein